MSEVEADQEPGALHPRHTYLFEGNAAAEACLGEALQGRRMHHAWLINGPKGVGKATLAYRFTRRLLGAAPVSGSPLASSPEDPVAGRIAALSHPDFFLLRRTMGERGKVRRDIGVDDARELGRFLSMQPAEGGWRVAIIDSVDELNRNAANAILKTLEEPPPRTVLLLVCHAPGAALATIRSRCRRLALEPLPAPECARVVQELSGRAPSELVLRLAGGSPGRALGLLQQDTDQLWQQCREATAAAISGKAHAFAGLAGAGLTMDRLQLLLELTQHLLRATAAPRPGEQEALGLGRLEVSSEAAARAWSDLGRLREQAESLGMDSAHALVRIGIVLDHNLQRRQASR